MAAQYSVPFCGSLHVWSADAAEILQWASHGQYNPALWNPKKMLKSTAIVISLARQHPCSLCFVFKLMAINRYKYQHSQTQTCLQSRWIWDVYGQHSATLSHQSLVFFHRRQLFFLAFPLALGVLTSVTSLQLCRRCSAGPGHRALLGLAWRTSSTVSIWWWSVYR